MNIYIHTQGCSANQSDSEVMAGILLALGYRMVESPEETDIIILNTCTVKSPTEMKAYSLLKKWKGKKIIVAGCIPQSDQAKLKGYSLIGTRQVHRIGDVVHALEKGENLTLLDVEKSPRLNLSHVRKNPVVEIVPINAGCLGACAFCKTKQARGNLYSYAMHDIVKQVETAVKEGVKEVWLTSQDTGAYGKDIKTNLPALLRSLVKIEGDFKIRIGMMNPDHLKTFIDELIPLMRHPSVFKFLHIPVQSGADKVVQDMQRYYAVSDFVKMVKRLRKEIPGMTIATDIICGYPTETEDDFQKTVDLLEDLKIPVVNISKFYPRPDTAAASLQKIPTHLVKERSTRIVDLQKKIIDNKDWLGWTGPVLVDEEKKGCMVGRNEFYTPVLLKGKFALGEIVQVKIIATSQFDLRAELI